MKTLLQINNELKTAADALLTLRGELLKALQQDEVCKGDLERIICNAQDVKNQASEIINTAEGK